MLMPQLGHGCKPSDSRFVRVVLSQQEQRWWKLSTPLAFGRYGYIRKLNEGGPFPVIKLANHGPNSRSLIEAEFRNLKLFRSLGLPVPDFSDKPLLDDVNQSIIGFRMAELFRIPWSGSNGMRSQMPLVEGAVWDMHQKGVVHGDLSESNIMWTENHTIVFIDLSHAKIIDPHNVLDQTADDLDSVQKMFDWSVRSTFGGYTRH